MNKIAELRKQNRITQEKLASKIGVARSTLAMYETNKSEPDYETLIKLAEYFNVTVDYLLGREDNPGGTTTANAEYTEEEKQIIEDYRSLSPDLQGMIKRTLDIYTQRDTKKINQ